jgi:hypothetical protein
MREIQGLVQNLMPGSIGESLKRGCSVFPTETLKEETPI